MSQRSALKPFFQTGDIPTQTQFYQWLDDCIFADEMAGYWTTYLGSINLAGFDITAVSGSPDTTDTVFTALEKLGKAIDFVNTAVPNTVATFNASKQLASTSISTTSLGFINGLTGNVETRLTNLETGLSWKPSVKIIADAPIALSGTYTLQSYALQPGDRVLPAAQGSGVNNGIYVVASGAWTRATDFDSSADNIKGSIIPCEQGTYLGKAFTCTNTGAVIVGTTPLTFTLFGGTIYTGTGGRISVSGSVIDIDASYIGQNTITTLGTITTGTLGSGSKILVGSDVNGDIWFNGGSGVVSRSNKLKWDYTNNALCVGGNWQGWPVQFYGSASVVGIDSTGSGTHLAFQISGSVRSYIGASSTQSLTVYDNTANHLWLSVDNTDGSLRQTSSSGVDARLSTWLGNPAIYLLDSGVTNSTTNFAVAEDGHNLYLNAIDNEIRLKVGGTTYLTVSSTSSSVNGSMVAKQYYASSATPAIVAGTGAGTSPTISISGTNQSGTITITTGTLPVSGGIVATITLSGSFAFPSQLDVAISPASSTAVLASAVFAVDTSTSTWKIQEGTGLGLSAATTYVWKYIINGK